VTGLRTRITARTGGDAAECFLPVAMSTQAAPAEAIATQGVINIAALYVTPTKTSGGGDPWVGACSAKAEVATVDEVAVGEAEMRVDRNGALAYSSRSVCSTASASL
jgi:hypothetical protein